MSKFPIGDKVDKLIKPSSIAIIGVSGDPSTQDKTGGSGVLANLIHYGFEGDIYLVNPKHKEIRGYQCYPSIAAIGKPVDLAVISIPAKAVPRVLEECGKAGCQTAIIVSSGFSEVKNDSGRKLQEQLVKIAVKYRLRVLGPNNLGVYNCLDGIAPSTSTALFYYDYFIKGAIGWVSQSGALCSTIHSRAYDRNIGLSYVITSGNECDLEGSDFLWYMARDERVKVIGMYVETIKDKEKFAVAAKEAERNHKPVLVYKAGVTKAGAAATQAHTGSVAGDIREYREFFKQYKVIMADSFDELYSSTMLLEYWYGKAANRYAIIAISGGEGGILADGLLQSGMELAEFQDSTRNSIAEIIPDFASPNNPVDVTAHMMRHPENIFKVSQILEHASEVDGVIYSMTTVARARQLDVAKGVAQAIKSSKKAGAVCWYAGDINKEAVEYLQKERIPVFTDNTSLLLALKRSRQFHDYQQNM